MAVTSEPNFTWSVWIEQGNAPDPGMDQSARNRDDARNDVEMLFTRRQHLPQVLKEVRLLAQQTVEKVGLLSWNFQVAY
jgi:hypothetical protein